jgi:3-methyl-2-oxobutanoate hydroxymethyltransferase
MRPVTGGIRKCGTALEDIVSITTGDFRSKITSSTLLDKKQRHEIITCLTAYDYAGARLVDEAGIDIVLVGDSLGMVMLGYENTLPVTVQEMLHHTRAVRRGVKRAFLVADMPFASYHVSQRESIRNAARFIKEGGAEAVKIEGGEKRARLVQRLVESEIPVVGHIGLTPQSVHAMGGYKVQGKTLSAVEQLMHDAIALERAGACCVVLEGIPREVAAMITHELEIPTIGIGAGPECDGQVLVFHDLLGLTFAPAAKFVRRYADVGTVIGNALLAFKDDVKAGSYPSDAESYHLPKETLATLQSIAERKRTVQL